MSCIYSRTAVSVRPTNLLLRVNASKGCSLSAAAFAHSSRAVNRRLYDTRPTYTRSLQVCYATEIGQLALVNDTFDNLFVTSTIAAILGFTALSALPILSGEASKRNAWREQKVGEDPDVDADNIKWGVMGVISIIPYVNWTAWVFAAMESEDRQWYYYTLAALYALPYLHSGLRVDWFDISSILLCALHVQVERIAQTESVALDLVSSSSALKTPSRPSQEDAKYLEDNATAFRDAVQDQRDEPGPRQASEIVEEEREVEVQEVTEQQEAAARELKEWDRRFGRKPQGGQSDGRPPGQGR